MTPSTASNEQRFGHEEIVAKIDRTAQALTERVDRVFGRIDDLQSRWHEATGALERHPGRVIVTTFLAGVLVGMWLSQD
jgi:hypothetical protein